MRLAQAVLEHGFGSGELDAIIDALRFLLRHLDNRGTKTALPRQRDAIGEIEFVLRIGAAYGFEKVERDIAPQRHQPAIREADFALGGGGILVLADGFE